MKVTAIYMMTSPSNKIYIGQTRNLRMRLSKYKGAHCIAQPHLYNSLKKYGFQSHQFRILQYLPPDITQADLNAIEVFCINQYQEAGSQMLNVREGGSNGKLKQESIQKMREKLIITINTPEYRAKISKIRKGKGRTPENLKRLEDARKNRVYKKLDEAGRARMKEISRNQVKGPMSEETKEKIRKALKGRRSTILSKEALKIIAEKNRGKKMPEGAKAKISEWHRQKIAQYTMDGALVRYWSSAKEACDTLGLHRGHMCNILKGVNIYKGYKWHKA